MKDENQKTLSALTSCQGKLGGLTSILHDYADSADIPNAKSVQLRMRIMMLRYQSALLKIKELEALIRCGE